jgi:DNA-binding protein H-NS
MAKSTDITSTKLLQQVAELQRQAEELKRKEIPGVVARIKEAIAFYGLTAADLGLGAAAARKAKTPKSPKGSPAKKSAAGKPPSVIKYGDNQGHTWSGRGPKPQWFKDALSNGTSEESLRVAPQAG